MPELVWSHMQADVQRDPVNELARKRLLILARATLGYEKIPVFRSAKLGKNVSPIPIYVIGDLGRNICDNVFAPGFGFAGWDQQAQPGRAQINEMSLPV